MISYLTPTLLFVTSVCIFSVFLLFFVNIFKDINYKYLLLASLVFVISVSCFSLFLVPGQSFDLSVYYRIYDRFKVTQFLGTEFSNNVILFKLAFFLLCQLNSREWIQFFFVFFVYTLSVINFVLAYRLLEKKDIKYLLFSCLLLETLMSFVYVYSGGRNQIAFGIAAFSLLYYWNYYKKNSTIYIVFILLISSFLIHDSSIIIITIFIIANFKFNRFIKYSLFIWPMLIYPVNELLKLSNNSIIQNLSFKITMYFENSMKTLDLRIWILNIIILILCLFVFKNRNKQYSNNHEKVISFLEIFLFFALGATFLPEVQRRLLYFLAFLSPFVVNYWNSITNKRIKLALSTTFIIFVLGLGMYHVVNFTANGGHLLFGA